MVGSGLDIRVVSDDDDGTILSVVTFDEGDVLDETFTAIAPCGATCDEIGSIADARAWLEFGPVPEFNWAEAAQDAMERRAENGRW